MKEAIILAGGFGTRLQHIIKEVPKPMAPIKGTPFLWFLLKKLAIAKFQHIILSTGYLHEKIEKYFKHSFENMRISYAQETEPLGTGGAIRFAMNKAETDSILVLNGDTFFDIDFQRFENFYQNKKTLLAVALRKVEEVSRYGSVQINEKEKIIGFVEKNVIQGTGLINGGIYFLNKKLFENKNIPQKNSFEKEILEKQYRQENFFGMPFDDDFIDIGIPEDYKKAQNDILKCFAVK